MIDWSEGNGAKPQEEGLIPGSYLIYLLMIYPILFLGSSLYLLVKKYWWWLLIYILCGGGIIFIAYFNRFFS